MVEKKINDRKLVGHQDMLECFETRQEALFVQEKKLTISGFKMITYLFNL